MWFEKIKELSTKIKREKEEKHDEKRRRILQELNDSQNERQKRSFEAAGRQGSSVWLSALPKKEDNFNLNKQEFRDTLNVRYGKTHDLPDKCRACDESFSLKHALKCQVGGFVVRRHNEVRNEFAAICRKLNTEVEVEPKLLPVGSQSFYHKQTKTKDNSHPDVMVRGLFQDQQGAYTDIKVFDPAAPSYLATDLDHLYKDEEKKKCTFYKERIQKVDHGSFFPAIFSVMGVLALKSTRLFPILLKNFRN